MAKDDLESSTGGRNVPQTHKLPINIRQPQGVSLMMWVPPWVRAAAAHVEDAVTAVVAAAAHVADAVAAAVARPTSGRPREYDVDGKISGAAKDCAAKGIEDYFARFVARVRYECKNKRPCIKTPKRTQMNKICRPVWEERRAQLAKK